MKKLVILTAILLGSLGVVQAEQPEVITDEVKLIHNDDSVKLHKKIYQLQQRIDQLESQLAKEKEYGTI
nr:MAG TPA: Protein of unknown function (DUF3138) [Caudoviricetes sp.]